MRMVDIISKKKYGEPLTDAEISFFIEGFTKGEIPDYQMAALLMAIYFKGMTEAETTALTKCMATSGDTIDLSSIKGIKVDKHSTGGVGDKTTLIVAPIVAACGVKVAKMSGRGLGHTGGTIDKLEAIEGFNTSLSTDKFLEIVNKIGVCVVGQTGNLAPADKKLYALRDVISAVDCIPLIASSIMSKKLAAGADCILLDVKTGTGAFMKTLEDATELARQMVEIGYGAGKKVTALVTEMDIPLGHAIGNSLEVIEAVEILNGKGPEDLYNISITLAANMLVLADIGDLNHCTNLAKEAVQSGKALQKLSEMVSAQGGNENQIKNPALLPTASVIYELSSPTTGYIKKMNTEAIGISSMLLGAGRETKASTIDYSAGIIMKKKTGDYINKGEPLAVFHTNNNALLEKAAEKYLSSLTFSDNQPLKSPLILAKIEKDNIVKY